LLTPADVAEGVRALARRAPHFAAVIAQHGVPAPRPVDNHLASLLRIVVEQLISLKAAAAIWQRMEQKLSPFAADQILACGEEGLRHLGLTAAKARCCLGLAQAVSTGELNLAVLSALPDEEARSLLLGQRGIGPWTADIYLMTALQRCDVWPAADLALQVAAQSLFEMEQRPDVKAMQTLADDWRPWRSVAALLLWSHYRGLKGLQQARN
jgi:DNA-3-methyladenine glycosylase II